MAKYNSMDDEIKRYFTFFRLLVLTPSLSAIIFVFWAEKYPSVWRQPTTMNAPKSVIYTSAILAIIVTLIFIAIYFLKFKNNAFSISDGWWALLLFYSCSGAATFMLFIQGIIVINGYFDKSEAKTFRTAIIRKRTVKKSNNLHRFIDVKDWHNPSTTVQFRASRDDLDTIPIGTPVRVVTKSGALGYEWIVSRSTEAK